VHSILFQSVSYTASSCATEKGCEQKLLHSCHFLAAMILDENQKINTEAAVKVGNDSMYVLRAWLSVF
jgi:hypothetical protein